MIFDRYEKCFPKLIKSQAWCLISVISVLWRLRQEDHELNSKLSYIVSSCPQTKQKKTEQNLTVRVNFHPLSSSLHFNDYK